MLLLTCVGLKVAPALLDLLRHDQKNEQEDNHDHHELARRPSFCPGLSRLTRATLQDVIGLTPCNLPCCFSSSPGPMFPKAGRPFAPEGGTGGGPEPNAHTIPPKHIGRAYIALSFAFNMN